MLIKNSDVYIIGYNTMRTSKSTNPHLSRLLSRLQKNGEVTDRQAECDTIQVGQDSLKRKYVI